MAVLLQYNVSTTWTATQLSDATGIKMDLLLQVSIDSSCLNHRLKYNVDRLFFRLLKSS